MQEENQLEKEHMHLGDLINHVIFFLLKNV